MPDLRGSQPAEFETPMFVPGRKGVNLALAPDQLDPEEARVRRNLIQYQQGEQQVRPGQTTFLSGIGEVHSILTMNRPSAGAFTRFWGGGTTWYRGNTPPLTALEAGFSGFPLTMLAYRPALTGDPWVIVADNNKVRQVAATGSPTTLGLAAPADAPTAAIAEVLTTGIAAFDSSDSTAAANWVLTAGFDRTPTTPNAGGIPTAADVVGLSGSAVEFTTVVGAALTSYSSVAGRAKTIDLTTLQGGAVDATDDDLIHLWIRVDRPDRLEELRIYFVCAAAFSPSQIPGAHATDNTDAFLTVLRPHDFTSFMEGLESVSNANQSAQVNEVTRDFLDSRDLGLTDALVAPVSGTLPVPPTSGSGTSTFPTQPPTQFMPGRSVWSEFGNIDRPLRRGQFLRIGNTPGRGWDTITGIVIVVQTVTNQVVKVACDDWFLTGGYNLDTTEPGATAYDWRVTNYHTVTGDESNPSPEMPADTRLECMRRRANVTPAAIYGDPLVRQRFYRRGGTLPTDWHFVGTNTADGAFLTDNDSDTTASASATLELDNDQPISTVTNTGATVLAQPIPVIFGPIEGRLFGLGDPNRPGHLYYSKAGRAGSWPAANVVEVCSPSETLMMGTDLGGVGFVLSRKRGYRVTPNLVSGEVSVQGTGCQVGIVSRWAWAQSEGGVYFVSADPEAPGVYVTNGAEATCLSDKIRTIFLVGFQTAVTVVDALCAVDWAECDGIRLAVYNQILWFLYTDTTGTRRTWNYNLLTGEWYEYVFALPPVMAYPEPVQCLNPEFFLGTASTAETHEGTTDNGTVIACRVCTGFLDGGRKREDKQLGDVGIDADIPTGGQLNLTTRLNNGLVNPTLPATTVTGRQRYIFDPFGTEPQQARNVQLDISWNNPAGSQSALYIAGIAYVLNPDETILRATTWETFETEQYVWAMSLTCDTGGVATSVVVEGTAQGNLVTLATLSITASARRTLQFSWPAQRVEQIRLRPASPGVSWQLYKYDWVKTAEPPRIAGWDTTFENPWDSYYTGLDLEVDTLGVEKRVEVYVDQAILTNPATGLTYFPVTASGRRVVHLTFTPGRGHVYHVVAIDANPGRLYSHRWHLEGEPSEQANWNQNYTLGGSLTNKSIKGVLLECDTFGANKTVTVELDGVVIPGATQTVNHNGRLVAHLSWPGVVGKVLRLFPTDTNPGRLYSLQWVFDEEPLGLTRWETQRLDHGIAGQQVLYGAMVTLSCTADVTLQVSIWNQLGVLVNTRSYTLAATAKRKVWVPFRADRGVLFQYVFTSAAGFLLYREESAVLVLPLGASSTEPVTVRPFGSDDLDKVRAMGNASGVASTPDTQRPMPQPVGAGLLS